MESKMRLKYRGVRGSLDWDDREECFHGLLLDVDGACFPYDGKSYISAVDAFKTAVVDYLAWLE